MHWIEPPLTPSAPSFPELPPILAQALARRGFTSLEAARAFLDPDEYLPCRAEELPGMPMAVERVLRAIRKHESICVWGDFDVDGQTSTTVLVQALRALGADVTYHLPVRLQESHGVGLLHLQEIIDQGTQLVLTCDTGITAMEAVEYARSRGVDMVITAPPAGGRRVHPAAELEAEL